MADITINGITVDPLAQPSAGLATASESVDVALAALKTATAELPVTDTNYVLVQVAQPLTATQRGALEAVGATVLEYVPENSYVCHFVPPNLAPVRQLAFVVWAGPYLRGFKIAAQLLPINATNRMSLAVAAAGPAPVHSTMPQTIDLLFHRDVDAVAAAEKVAQIAGLDPDEVKPAGNKVRIVVAQSRLSELARIDEVRTIEPVVPVKLHNDIARRILGVDLVNPGPLPFEGDGQVVAVADTGFDKGHTTNVHPAFAGRVSKLYALGRKKSNDPHGHGTHVAGSVLGDGNSATLGHRVRGTAPHARLVLQSLLDSAGGLGGIPANLQALFSPPYLHDDARVHTNSWGSTIGDGRYDSQASELDDFVWKNRDCVICFAAGNEGTDADGDGAVDPTSVTPPGTAKNCITVGACENDRPTFALTYGSGWPSDFPTNPLASDLTANNPDGIVAFSSRGPTLDRRFKPDIVAPGTYVLSARSRDTSSKGWGVSADPQYMFEGGTSMATPLVAGCCALLREYLNSRKGMAKPSAALVKALLINGAVDMAGQYVPSECGPIPNFAEGFGRVDMQATIGAGADQVVVLRDENGQLDTGEEQQITLQIPPGATRLKATLVWTDPAGATLQNDLDLIVGAAGQELHGNVGAGSTAFDRVNNVEQVVWDNPPAGQVTVVVRAFRITKFPQSFALVVRLA